MIEQTFIITRLPCPGSTTNTYKNVCSVPNFNQKQGGDKNTKKKKEKYLHIE